ncbi:MAG: hypothetical protein QOE89_1722 [Pseudonocardiales bacterium]|nr:hypothetical protein [Pseudonocardiales bacterium]
MMTMSPLSAGVPWAADDSDYGNAHGGDYYADLVEQLFREYECVLPLRAIVALVSECRHDLAGTPATAMPELLERLARCRLSALFDDRTHN